jgi:DDE domain
MDETYIRVKGEWRYLYRAVDSSGATLDFLLSAKQDAASAKRFLAKALGRQNHPMPRVINTDGHSTYPPAIARLKAEGALDEDCRHRPVPYLNNVLEQDHRAIKRRVNASQHFRSFWGAWRTIAGYEAIHMIRQRPGVQECDRLRVPVCCTASFLVCLESKSDPFGYRTHLHSNSKVATLPFRELLSLRRRSCTIPRSGLVQPALVSLSKKAYAPVRCPNHPSFGRAPNRQPLPTPQS